MNYAMVSRSNRGRFAGRKNHESRRNHFDPSSSHSREKNIGKPVRRKSILHPICTVSRTSLYNMVILFSVIVAAIVIASSIIRGRDSFGSSIRSEIVRGKFPAARERREQSATLSPSKPFLIVVLPDGTTVTQRVAGQV
jgi:hypothetical protein